MAIKVVDETEIYGDRIFTVIGVDPGRRLLQTETELFGSKIRVELKADEVRKA